MQGKQLKHWLGKGVWTVMDQGFFAFSNFILNIVLARWLSENDYGNFSVAFSIFLLMGVIFNALMVEPMMVYGAGRYEGRFSKYVAILSELHWKRMAWALSVLGLVVAVFYVGSATFYVLVYLALLSGLMFYQWLLRRACYLIMEPHIAAIAGFFYFVVMMLGVFLLRENEKLNAVSGILMMALASVVAACFIKWRLSRQSSLSSEITREEVVADHWTYGRWAIGTNILSWIPGNIYFIVLSWWYAERTPGDLRALFNFALPMLQLVGAFGPMVIPILVRSHREDRLEKMARSMGLAAIIATSIYAVSLLFLGTMFMDLIYKGKYASYADLLWLVGILPIFASLVLVYGSAIRAMEKPKLVFKAYLGVNVVCLLVGLPLTYHMGVKGAILGMLAATGVNSMLLYYLFHKHRIKEERQVNV